MDIIFAEISLAWDVSTITFSSFMSLCGNLVSFWRRSHIFLSSSASDVASFGRVGEEVCCKNDLTLPLVIWRNESPDDIPLRVDSRIDFRVELMKFVVAFRRKLICDISHINILPNGVVLWNQNIWLTQNAAKHMILYHNQSVSNRTSGIEFRYGGDGYAANSKFRYTGPVGFPN